MSKEEAKRMIQEENKLRAVIEVIRAWHDPASFDADGAPEGRMCEAIKALEKEYELWL